MGPKGEIARNWAQHDVPNIGGDEVGFLFRGARATRGASGRTGPGGYSSR